VRWHQIRLDLAPVATLADLPRHLAPVLQAAAAGAGDVLHAVRVVLSGETALQAQEAAQPGTLAAAVQAAAQDVANAQVWIEQVRLNLRSPVDRARLAQGNDALGELVRWVDVLSADGPALRQFCDAALSEVLAKVPAEVRDALARDAGSTDIPDLDDGAALLALLRDAEGTLLARLHAGSARA